jgi:hypothetical protein
VKRGRRRPTASGQKPTTKGRRPARTTPTDKDAEEQPFAPPFSDPGISHPKKRAFLAAFAESGNISRAAAAAEIDRRTHTNWLKDDKDYAAAFLEAREHAADTLEELARLRAAAGSDLLMIFLLKGLRPDIYRERHEITGKKGKAIETVTRVVFGGRYKPTDEAPREG